MWGSYSWNVLSAAFWEHRVKKWLDWEERETKRFALETLYVSVFLNSGVPLLCDNRDPGVDCVGEPQAWEASCCPGEASGSAEFSVESHELSGIDTQSRVVKPSSCSDLCRLWWRPRASITLLRDCVHFSDDPKLIWWGHVTNNLPLWRRQHRGFTHLF